jgi:mannose-6-phosphate isomerase-like protein (cupin superfamily)
MATARKVRKAKRAMPSSRTARKTSRRSGKPAARRRVAHGATKAKAALRKQTFVASHHHPDAFDAGLRSYAKYRDLGIAKATHGLARAHVIKMVPPCDPKVVSKRHYHDVEFQMIYVLKGWITGEYEGEVVTMREGSCWLQPPKIKHTVLDYSDDCEVLEIILPADFDTVELE